MIKQKPGQNPLEDIELYEDPYRGQFDRTLQALEMEMTEKERLDAHLRDLAAQKRAQDQKLYDQMAVIQQKKLILRDLLSKPTNESGTQTEISSEDVSQLVAHQIIIPKENSDSEYQQMMENFQPLQPTEASNMLDFGPIDFRMYIGILVQSKQRLLSEVTKLDEEPAKDSGSFLGKLASATQGTGIGKLFSAFGGKKPEDQGRATTQQPKWSASEMENRNEAISNHQVTWSDEVLVHLRNPQYWEVCRQKMCNLVRSGSLLPLEARGDVWRRLLGNRDNITRRMFTFFAESRETCSPTVKRMIDLDLHRVFPELNISPRFAEVKQEARKVLQMFELHRPDIGYRSGFGHIVVGLRMHLNTYDTFAAFCSFVLGDPFQYLLATENQALLGEYFTALDTLISQKLPLVGRKFEEAGITSITLGYSLFAVLGAVGTNFGIDKQFRIWDMYFLKGEVVIVRMILLALSRLPVPDHQDPGSIWMAFRDLEALVGKDYYTCLGSDLLTEDEYKRTLGNILTR